MTNFSGKNEVFQIILEENSWNPSALMNLEENIVETWASMHIFCSTSKPRQTKGQLSMQFKHTKLHGFCNVLVILIIIFFALLFCLFLLFDNTTKEYDSLSFRITIIKKQVFKFINKKLEKFIRDSKILEVCSSPF